MSRIPKWKFDKAKVKVVFRLQFHATNIPQAGWDKLFVSFIPADIGKATAKTNKANVRNGNCKWADPIYETTRLIQDTSTKKYDEKLYKLVVAMGTSRSSALGEVYINLADYADASKPTSIALPLDGCVYGTILHVTVQLLTSKTGFREFEHQREIREKSIHLTSNQRQESVRTIRDSAEGVMDQIDKVNARVRFKPESTELHSLEEVCGLNEDFEDSAAGVDGSSCTSDSICAEKFDSSSTHESDITKITISGEVGGFPVGQSAQPETREKPEYHLMAQGSNEWAHGWSSDYSVDNDLSSVYDENIRIKGWLDKTESSLLEMKMEINSLQSLADELGAETQRLTHQFISELASGEVLAKELSSLKSECSKLKDECDTFRHNTRMINLSGRRIEDLFNPVVFSETPSQAWPAVRKSSFDRKFENADGSENQQYFLKCHSQWLEGLTLLDDKVNEIRNKAQFRFHKNDVDYLSDFEGLEYILQSLKQCIIPSSSGITPMEASNIMVIQATDVKQLAPMQSFPDQEQDNKNMMKENICKLLTELEESKAEQESLMKKMSQMGCYYEALIHELEDKNKDTLKELEIIRPEHFSCLSTISALQSQIEKMHQDMNEQFLKLAEDKWYLESLNKELEKRAVASETALHRVRCTYSVAVDRLQKDLELLSVQVLSMFETNENLAKQAFSEASILYLDEHPQENPEVMHSYLKSDLRPSCQQILNKSSDLKHHLGPMLVNDEKGASPLFNGATLDCKPELQSIRNVGAVYVNGSKAEKVRPGMSSQISICGRRNLVSHTEEFIDMLKNDELPGYAPILKPKNHPEESKVGVPIISENTKTKSEVRGLFHVKENLNLDMDIEIYELHMLNVHLDVFSKVLQETFHEKKCFVRNMKDQMDELSQQLECSTKSEGLLLLKLQAALDDVRILREDVIKFSAKCDDLTMEKYIVEAKLQDVFDENSSLARRLAEFEILTIDLKVFESKYNHCSAENLVLENLLKEESLQKIYLQSELKSMIEDYNVLKVELDKKSSAKDDLEKTFDLLGEKLRWICSNVEPYCKQEHVPDFAGIPLEQKLENKDYLGAMIHLEQLQLGAYKKILELSQEKEKIVEEKVELQSTLKDLESQRFSIKCKSDSVLADSMTKLDLSNSLVEKLKSEIQDVRTKLEAKVESEQKLAENNRALASKLTVLEYKLQDTVNENKDVSQRLLEFDRINEELKRARVDVVNCSGEKETLMFSLQSADEATSQLGNELNNLKEQLTYSNIELQAERGTREKLQETLTNLTLQLDKKNEQILSLDKQKAELVHLRLQVSNFESEKSGLRHLLLHHEEHQRNLDGELSFFHNKVADVESELTGLKDALKSKHGELHAERGLREEMEGKLADLTLQLNDKCEQLLSFHEQESELAHLKHLVLTIQSDKSAVEQHLLENKECRKELDTQISILHSQVTNLETELNKTRDSLEFISNELLSEREIREKLEGSVSDFMSILNEKQEQLLHFEEQKDELAHLWQQVLNLESEKCAVENLLSSSKERINESDTQISVLWSQVTDLDAKLSNSRESLQFTQNELHSEREIRIKLEATVSDLTSMLNEKQEQLVSFHDVKAELISLKQQVTDLKSEKSEVLQVLFLRDEFLSKIGCENLSLQVKVTALETELEELHDCLLGADVEVIFIRSQYQTNMAELFGKFKNLEELHEVLLKNHVDVVATLQNCMASKEQCLKENEILSAVLLSLKSHLHLDESRKEDHVDLMHKRTLVLDKVKNFKVAVECKDFQQKHHLQKEIEQLNILLAFEKEMENLRSSRDEHEITGIILRSKLYEQQEQITSLQQCHGELINLQDQHRELSHRLSEQILKTEEFKNLSIHLKELKDKADAECHQIREKRENEGPSVPLQESLRVAFIKEQYETKLQELQSQLYMSKKHGEEILLKLQNALDEVESRKKGEASHVKRNEELSIKILELEAELQAVVTDRRELVKAYDKVKAELECSSISLECWKEEKVKLEASLRECNEDRKKARVELDLTKRRMESLTSTSDSHGSYEPDILKSTSFGQLLEEHNFVSAQQQIWTVRGASPRKDAVIAAGIGVKVPISGYAHSKEHSSEDGRESKSSPETSWQGSTEKVTLMQGNSKYIADLKGQAREQQNLEASIERLHQELERMKNENLASLLPVDGQWFDPSLQRLEKELLQLNMANEHLGTIFPSFKGLPGSGNALERVLALELELAEALQAKQKSEVLFQSSFLGHHSDEEAVYRSFRDINELIKDMLDMKGKYAAVETELKEMQSRYSQLSLQFAEVEGERQKLIMTLKNTRTPKKVQF
uniref:Myosin-2 n=1 Tax=Anthurium amnicola TaxID=1678845 RepID=A0A1D1XQ81_9ARAE